MRQWGVEENEREGVLRRLVEMKFIDDSRYAEAFVREKTDTMRMRLEQRLGRKMRTVKYTSPYDLRTKLMRYALSLGYDFDTAGDAVEKTMRDIPSQE